MARRGPQPIPLEKQKARGNPRKLPDLDERLARAPKFEKLTGTAAPRELDAKGKAEWKQLAPLLERQNLLTVADLPALARLCYYRALWSVLSSMVAEGDLLTATKAGMAKHPAAVLLLDVGKQVLTLEREFGLTPSARTSLSAPAPPQARPKGKGKTPAERLGFKPRDA